MYFKRYSLFFITPPPKTKTSGLHKVISIATAYSRASLKEIAISLVCFSFEFSSSSRSSFGMLKCFIHLFIPEPEAKSSRQLVLEHPQANGASLYEICPISKAWFFTPLINFPSSIKALPIPVPTYKATIESDLINSASATTAHFRSFSISNLRL